MRFLLLLPILMLIACEKKVYVIKPKPNANKTCFYNGNSILAGQTVTGYVRSIVPYGQTCQPLVALCDGKTGELSSNPTPYCSVEPGPLITYSPIYSDYGNCSARLPCSGIGYQSRAIIACQKFINGQKEDGLISDCFNFMTTENLQVECLSPPGEGFFLYILGGTLNYFCDAGQTVSLSPSIYCTEGYSENYDQLSCDENHTKNLYRLGEHIGGPNNEIKAIEIQSDNKLIIGGTFTTYNGVPRKFLARLNPDYSLDHSFLITSGIDCDNSDPNCGVYSIHIQPDGKILVGGKFAYYNNTNVKSLIRLNSNGTIDKSFSFPYDTQYPISSIAIQSNGAILINSGISSYGFAYSKGLSRVKANGTIDESFNPWYLQNYTAFGVDHKIEKIVLQSDERIIIVGQFNYYNGIPRGNIARLNSNGSLDETNFIIGASALISDIIVLPNDFLMIGGDFVNYNNQSIYRVAKISPNGELDNSFSINPWIAKDQFVVKSLALQGESHILVGGYFIKSSENETILKIDNSGDLDQSFSYNLKSNGYNNVIKVRNNNEIIIGGNFQAYSNDYHPINYLFHLNPDGSSREIIKNFHEGFNYFAKSFKQQSDQKILIGGETIYSYNIPVRNLFRIYPDGTLDSTFSHNLNYINSINSIELQSDDKILIGGKFGGSYNQTYVTKIARLNIDGSLDTSFTPDSSLTDVKEIILQSDNKILLLTQDSLFNYSLSRLTPNGSIDLSFQIANFGNLQDIPNVKLQSSGKIVVAGFFKNFNGTDKDYLVRLNTDGTLDESFFSGFPEFYNRVHSLAIQSDDTIIVGGELIQYGTQFVRNLVKLSPDGFLDPSFNTNTKLDHAVYSIFLVNDNKILISGYFKHYREIFMPHIARINQNGELDLTFNSGFRRPSYLIKNMPTSINLTHIQTFLLQENGQYIIGGKFNSYDDQLFDNIIKINPDGSIAELP